LHLTFKWNKIIAQSDYLYNKTLIFFPLENKSAAGPVQSGKAEQEVQAAEYERAVYETGTVPFCNKYPLAVVQSGESPDIRKYTDQSDYACFSYFQ